MSDPTTKPSPRSRNTKANSRGAKTTAANRRRRVDPAEQLGELEFSDWYESPVFELSSEERMETRATAGRAPTRLLARAVIAAGARRDRLRAARQDRQDHESLQVEQREPSTPAPQPAAATPASSTPAPEPAPSRPAPQPTASKPPASKPPASKPPASKPPASEAAAPQPATPTPATPTPARPTPARLTPAPQPIPPEPLLIPELADRVGWRKRAASLLDRWADKEVAVATRLDQALAPAIPWANHDRKPAGSRDDATV